MAEHTKLPWQVSEVRTTEGTAMIVGGAGSEFGLIADVTKDDDAAFIVKACGSHYVLVKALEAALPIVADRSGGGRMLTSKKQAEEAFDLIQAALATPTTTAPTPLKAHGG